MTERTLERIFLQMVSSAGGWAIKLAPVHRGTPDRLVVWPGGRVDLVELKTSTGRLSPIQRVWHARAAGLGMDVTTLYGRAQVHAWVRARAALDVSGT